MHHLETAPGTIRLFQQRVLPLQSRANATHFIDRLALAQQDGIDLFVGTEMGVSGYMNGDHWYRDAFVRQNLRDNDRIRQATLGHSTSVITGGLMADFSRLNKDGTTRKYNAGLVFANGVPVRNDSGLAGWIPKTLLPNYDMFDDERYFYSAFLLVAERGQPLADLLQPFPIKIGGQILNVGVMLCEDMWSDDYSFLDKSIAEIYRDNGADLLVVPTASPYKRYKFNKRVRVAMDRVRETGLPLVYVNNVGPQDIGKNVFSFDGRSFVLNHKGELVFVAPAFAEGTYDIELSQLFSSPKTTINFKNRFEEELNHVLDHRISTLRYIRRLGTSKDKVRPGLIGLSGGQDSTLVFVIHCLAIGADLLNVEDGFMGRLSKEEIKKICLAGAKQMYSTYMPSKFSGEKHRQLAMAIAKNFGAYFLEFPIQKTVDLIVSEIENAVFKRPDGDEVKIKVSPLGLENIQARDRSSVRLQALASELGAFYTNNGNDNENARNYFTLYGDNNGSSMPLVDLMKDDRRPNSISVGSLLRYLGDFLPIPELAIGIKPTAELSDKQRDEGDPFDYGWEGILLDYLLNRHKDPEDILEALVAGRLDEELGHPGFRESFSSDKDFIKNLRALWHSMHASTFKRIQSPPNLSDGRVSYGFSHRETQAIPELTDRYLELEKLILEQVPGTQQ